MTPVPSPTANANPSYTYSSDEVGVAAFAGGCNSVSTAAAAANNTITLDSNGAGAPLAQGTYAACTIQVTDVVGNISNLLAISVFEIELTPPALISFTSSTADNTYGPGAVINITATYDEALAGGGNLTVTLTNGVNVLLNNVSGTTVFGSYTVGVTGSGQDSGDLSIGSIISESVSDLLGNNQTGSAVPAANLATSSDIVIDVTAPSLAEVTAVPTPTTNTNPDYTYSSDEAGAAIYAGGCNSVTTVAAVGNNTITLDSDGAGAPLANATYAACSIAVTDAVGNTGNLLFSVFVIASPGPGGITSGLEMWFRADEDAYQDNGLNLATNGQTIQRWNDQSGNSFDALQNNSGRRPVLTTNTAESNNFNPTVYFDGQNPNANNRDRMPILGKFYDTNSSLDQVYVYVAYKTDQDAEWAFIDYDRSEWYNINVQNNNRVQFNYRGNNAIRDNSVVVANARDGLPHVTSYIYDNTLTNETLIRFDGQEVLSANREPGGITLEDTTTRFGYIGDGSEATTFDSGANNIFYEGDIF